MIKCNVTVCGIINRDATTRTNKEGKPFFTFPLQIMVPATDGQEKPVEIDVSKDGGQEEASLAVRRKPPATGKAHVSRLTVRCT